MSLFPLWSGKITIPALPVQNQKVGTQTVSQRPSVAFVVQATLYDDERRGYRYLMTSLDAPFDRIFVRSKAVRRKKIDRGSLTAEDEPTSDRPWSILTKFQWDDISEILSYANTPQLILDSWANKFIFRSARSDSEGKGLRPPQLGALHAISAHFSVGKEHEPATVVLPTGTGKTETMLASMVYERPKGVLVLVPSIALRNQIAKKFENLGILRELGCIPEHTFNPKVLRLSSGLRDLAEAQQAVKLANVIIALPNTMKVSHLDAVNHICDNFEQIYIDEAHHLGANTWIEIRDKFLHKKIIQFTATPFRNDKKHIGGKIIFNYKLGNAQQDGYYKKIRLATVEEFGEDSARDQAIAEKAIQILRDDRNIKKLDHRILARVKNKEKADELLVMYRRLAPEFNPVSIYSGTGRTKLNEQALTSLFDPSPAGAKIIICVDMLGEGFDLPQLKIAAIHDNHKSLAITLQFIGRFTRNSSNVGEAAIVVNIADTNAEKRLMELYAEGADWDQLISQLSEDKIDEELHLQGVIESLKGDGRLHDMISLWNLNPSLSTQIFRTKVETWNPLKFAEAYSKTSRLWHSYSEDDSVLIVVGYHENPVKWGRYEEILETSYNLLIAYWDKDNNTLFMNSSDYDQMRVPEVARIITSQDTELLHGSKVFNVLNNVELPLAKSLGSSRIGAISFTSYFGPNVTEGLASIEKSEAQLNNIACLGYEDGNKVLWGAAQRKGKIWQQRSGTITEWLTWCSATLKKIDTLVGDETNITRDFLRPRKLDEHYAIPPISIQWGEYLQTTFSDSAAIIFGDIEIPLYQVGVNIQEAPDGTQIVFDVSSEEFTSTFSFKIGEKYARGYEYVQLSGEKVSFRTSRKMVREFDDQMYIDPLIIRYADGTFSYNNYHVPFDLNAGNYPVDQIEEWNWTGINLRNESMGRGLNPQTIQFRTYENIKDEHSVIFNDDGSGEAADLVGLRDDNDGSIVLTLYHCKGAHGGKVSSDIRNLYTLCGQAQKSIATKHEGLKKLSLDLRRRHEIWAKTGDSRLLKGNLKDLSYFVEKSRKSLIKFEVVLVQPGMSRASISSDMTKLLATTELFLKKTTDAEFRVIGSSS